MQLVDSQFCQMSVITKQSKPCLSKMTDVTLISEILLTSITSSSIACNDTHRISTSFGSS